MLFRIDNENLFSDADVAALGPIIESMSRDDIIRSLVSITPIGLQNIRAVHAAYKDIIRAKFNEEKDSPLPPDIQARTVTKRIDEVEVLQ